jgi:hypothetical protein
MNEHETGYDMMLCMKYLVHYHIGVRLLWMREIRPWRNARFIRKKGDLYATVSPRTPFSELHGLNSST